MHSFFEKPLEVIKKWPSMGPIASQRLFNSFLVNRSILKEFKKIVDFFEQYTTCTACQAPLTNTLCRNCKLLKLGRKILIVPNMLDFILLCEDFWERDCGFVVFNGYINALSQQSPDSIGLSSALKCIPSPDVPLYILFNQSLEARGTLWLIKGLVSPKSVLYDHSEFLGPKEALFALSPKELEDYKRQLLSKMSS